MRGRPWTLAGLVLLATSAAGCMTDPGFGPGGGLDASDPFVPFVTGSEPSAFHFPQLHRGDVYSQAFSVESRSPEGEVESRDWSRTSRILPESQSTTDRYGTPVQVVRIETETHGTDAGAFAKSPAYASDIEMDGGNWLRGGYDWVRYDRANVDMGPYCAVGANATIPLYRTEPVRYDFGQVWGRSLSVGETLEEALVRPSPYDTWQLIVRHHAIGYANLTSTLNGEARTLQVLIVEPETESVRLSDEDPKEEQPSSYLRVHRLYFADGIPFPVLRTDTRTWPDGSGSRFEERLTEYRPGTAALGLGRGPAAAQFQGPSPTADFVAFGFAPPVPSGVVEFPLEDAMAWLRQSPDALPTQAWLMSHPEAYVVDAGYWRDRPNQTFRWDLEFAGTDTVHRATVDRRPSDYGLFTDDAASGATMERSNRQPHPQRIRSVEVVDALYAQALVSLTVGHGGWDHFGWTSVDSFSDSGVDPGPSVEYEFGPGAYRRYGDLLSSEQVVWHALNIEVDARAGAVSNDGYDVSLRCGSGAYWLPI